MLAFTASAIAFYRLAPALPTTAAPPPDTVPATAQASPSGSPSSASPDPTGRATPSPSPIRPSTSPTPADPRSHVKPRTRDKLPRGPGTTEPGILLIAGPISDGTFDVSEVAFFPDPVFEVTLRPPKISALGGSFRTSKAVAEQVQVSAGDQPVVVPRGRVSRATTLAFADPAERVELRYQLTGVTKRTQPSRANRALAAIGPLIASAPADLPVAIMVTGRSVRNLSCPYVRLSKRACSTGRSPRLRVDRSLPARDATIQVQFDLPRPQ